MFRILSALVKQRSVPCDLCFVLAVLKECLPEKQNSYLERDIFCNASLMTMEYVQIRVNCRSTLGMLAGMMHP